MLLRKITLISAFLLISLGLNARDRVELENRPIEIIDTPTALTLDHYGYNATFRFGRDGNLQNKTLFGVLPRLNLGFGLDSEKVIGSQSARMNKPTINVKFKLFDGAQFIPALALGFDGQGYVFNRTTDEYEQREKGLYLVGTSEIFYKNLLLNYGGNVFDFDEGNSTRGFIGLNYSYQKMFGLMFEYDHLSHYRERRINYGLKYFVSPMFTVDVIARNLPKYSRAKTRETERIVKLSYTGSF
ncbi:MAG: hypothetical protein ACKVQC_02550 [Elusimicrobiota bacterium]